MCSGRSEALFQTTVCNVSLVFIVNMKIFVCPDVFWTLYLWIGSPWSPNPHWSVWSYGMIRTSCGRASGHCDRVVTHSSRHRQASPSSSSLIWLSSIILYLWLCRSFCHYSGRLRPTTEGFIALPTPATLGAFPRMDWWMDVEGGKGGRMFGRREGRSDRPGGKFGRTNAFKGSRNVASYNCSLCQA